MSAARFRVVDRTDRESNYWVKKRTMTDREPISGVDNAWRRIGSVNNLTTITGVLWFDDPITYEELSERLEERLLRFDRFTQRVEGTDRPFRRPYWESIEDFDIETHITHVALPEPQDKATFQRFVSGLMSKPLDECRPLWEAYLIDGAGGDDGNAVAFRINHSIGDGFALMYVLFGLVDDPDSVEMPMGIMPDPPSVDAFSEEEDDESPDIPEPTETPSNPDDEDDSGLSLFDDGPLKTARLAGKAVTTGWNLLTQDEEAETSLRGTVGTTKRAGWTEEIELDTIRAIGQANDATINDVLLAALTGALRRLLEDRGEGVEGLELRTTVPVNLKPLDERDASLGNYFGLAFVPIPVGEADLNERIRIIHERMDAQKAGLEALLMYLTLSVGGHTPDMVLDWLLEQFENRATGVVTNVPGPVESVEFAGKEVTDVMFWVPQANDQGIGISIFSYDGSVRVGIAADENLLSDPARLGEAFEQEIESLAEGIE
jgi:diacylglycerol O-acyltransferase